MRGGYDHEIIPVHACTHPRSGRVARTNDSATFDDEHTEHTEHTEYTDHHSAARGSSDVRVSWCERWTRDGRAASRITNFYLWEIIMNELEKEFWDEKEVKPMWARDNHAKVVKRSELPGPWEVQAEEADQADLYEPKVKIQPTKVLSINRDYLPFVNVNQHASVEKDPHGLDPHSRGAKLDQGKNRLGLVLLDFARALEEVGKVGTFGANKYTAHGWCSVLGGEERYTDALFRHLMAEGRGEIIDPDSQMLHAAQVAWNALARLTYILKRCETELALNAEDTCPKQ